jgi:hypothetical protein
MDRNDQWVLSFGSAPSAVAEGRQSAGLRLGLPYPNPFGSNTVLRFSLPAAAAVDLAIFDTAGRLVRRVVQGERAAGPHEAAWDGNDDTGQPASSGVYFVRIQTAAGSVTERLVLLRH